MALAVVASVPGRVTGLITVAAAPLTITLSATAYATASGGFAFDIANLLNQVGPWDSGVNPGDVFTANGFSSGGFLLEGFVVGTPTTTTNLSGQTVLATCPCTARLFGTGSANHAGLGEVADGNLTDVVTGMLFISRSGNK